MSVLSSMQYTIGTALERAREGGSTVDILVGGQWLSGLVVGLDGLGVVLDHEGEEHCIVRLECVTAVRVCARAPMLRRIPTGRSHDDSFDGARPMPGPHAASA